MEGLIFSSNFSIDVDLSPHEQDTTCRFVTCGSRVGMMVMYPLGCVGFVGKGVRSRSGSKRSCSFMALLYWCPLMELLSQYISGWWSCWASLYLVGGVVGPVYIW